MTAAGKAYKAKKSKAGHLQSAFKYQAYFLKRSDIATHSFTCKQAIPVFTPHPQSITAVWLVLILRRARLVLGWVTVSGFDSCM